MPSPTFSQTISTQEQEKPIADFSAIRLKIASPEKILFWSSGEVTKPETINYRTQKPERDGLFCEKIFGPVKDWECACGKYKKIRYKGIICDKCGVEVTKSIVRRERMGHINLAAPVSHIWFLKGVSSKIGLILDISSQELESVIYFNNFIIISVNEDLKKAALGQIEREYKNKKEEFIAEKEKQKSHSAQASKGELSSIEILYQRKLDELKKAFRQTKKELNDLKTGKIISELTYHNFSLKYGHIFEAGLGAGAVRKLLEKIDLKQLIENLEKKIKKAALTEYKKTVRCLKLAKALLKNDIKPEWMILTVLPVVPPDLRPMVQIDGGRFATADLNDLYRRVINRNNRFKRLIELSAPEIICRNEKRMLQEAVDALIDNDARRSKTVAASSGQKRVLKSIAGSLKGKQGRFRQNLLGKRVDYSGRSVIVVGPHLKLYQCGLPKTMAIELFKPFVITQLIKKGYAHNVRKASQMIEEGQNKEVWDILESITKGAHVLLNRAPTLHRLGIQAFQPILIEGKAIQIHPSVCSAFNADFDGDQMAVHIPLSEEAKKEAREIMVSSKNLLKPATGEPVVTPEKDMVWGAFYMTQIEESQKSKVGQITNKACELKDKSQKSNVKCQMSNVRCQMSNVKCQIFFSPEEVVTVYQMGRIKLNELIKVRIDNKLIETSAGRVLFNSILPEKIRKYDQIINRKALKDILAQTLEYYGDEQTVVLLDKIKEMTFEYLTESGLSLGNDDLPFLEDKGKVIQIAEEKVEAIEDQYQSGLLAEDEKYAKTVETWIWAMSEITELTGKVLSLNEKNPVFSMISSGARGSIGQITQMMGIKGLVTNPAGKIIELPIKNNYKEGLDVLEYFISTHGARKGLSDTALKTASAGYLTRRLVDVAQDAAITEKDCGDKEGFFITREECERAGETLEKRIYGRVIAQDIIHPKTKKILFKKGEIIDKEKTSLIKGAGVDQLWIRSVVTCKTKRGLCQKCYGYDLCYNKLVDLNTPVGIIAAQSIGEPGTQLTLRTFHTGGVAGLDITQGLPRVEELLEARPVKGKTYLAEVDGRIEIEERPKKIKIKYIATREEKYDMEVKSQKSKVGQITNKACEVKVKSQKSKVKSKEEEIILEVKDGEKVKVGDILFKKEGKETKTQHEGEIKIEDNLLKIIYQTPERKEYLLNPKQTFWVKEGDIVKKGDQLTDGNIDLHELYQLKGKEAVQKYILGEIQFLYFSHGQGVNSKHLETIIRQMFSRLQITDPGDSEFLIGEIIAKPLFEETNEELAKQKKNLAKGKELLLGITKASLSTESFLSAASFQETARILIEAATTGKIDHLRGLKENVIIGRLIPVGTGARRST